MTDPTGSDNTPTPDPTPDSRPPIPTPAPTADAAATPPTPPATPEPSLVPPPIPPKRGLPRWVWVVIAAAALVLIAVVVVIAMSLTSSDSDSDTPESVATPTSVPPEASTPPSTAPSATTEPETDAPTGSSTGNVSLDDAFVLGTSSPAIWKVTYGDGWEITTLDQGGVTVQTNAALNCTFTTVQNRQVPVNLPLTNDREDTELTVQALQQSFLSQAPDAVITNTPGLAIPYGEFGIYEADVEFAGFRADYVRADNGELWSSMFVTRTMPQIEGMMYSVLNCNKDTIDADETLWRGLLDKTLVASGDM